MKQIPKKKKPKHAVKKNIRYINFFFSTRRYLFSDLYNFLLSYEFFVKDYTRKYKKINYVIKNIGSFVFQTSGVFCYAHPPPSITYIRSFHFEHPAFYILNIRHFLFRTAVILCSEHPVFFVPNAWTTFIPNIRCFLFRSSGLFIPNIRTFSKEPRFGTDFSDRCP
jgi:hypothetical protein